MKNNETAVNRLLGSLAFIFSFFILTRTPVDADLWWHLRAGQSMWEQHKILLIDSFSYTRFGTPWVNAFWLSEIIFYLLDKFGGYLAITTFVSALGALTFYLIWHRLSGNPFVKTFIIILSVITASPIWGPRPQIISFLFIAILDDWLSRNKNKWFIISLFILWANIHGGWIWGFLLFIAQIVGLITRLAFTNPQERIIIYEKIKDMAICTVISAIAIGLNPNGLSIWKLPFEQIHVSMQIQEWLSPDFHQIQFHPFLWMIFLLILAAPFQHQPNDWPKIYKVLGFAYLTFVVQRNIALFAIVTAPLLVDWINTALQSLPSTGHHTSQVNPPTRFSFIFNNLLIVTLSTLAILYAFLVSRPSEVDKNYPTDAIAWISDHKPAGRLFNSYNWGGYILWNLQQYPVFIDGRADLYGNEIISQWQSVASAQANASAILDQWDVNIVLMESNSPVVKLLKADQWEITFQDEMSVVLIRK
ncbi:MAG: hypothetical protein JNM55_11840 [Anaerolineales bacterium]|nr:hypothetical protein [Anaerolineales bacterium]